MTRKKILFTPIREEGAAMVMVSPECRRLGTSRWKFRGLVGWDSVAPATRNPPTRVCRKTSFCARIDSMEPTASRDTPSMGETVPVIREHIIATPGTCGGKPRIAGSRIRVKDVVIWHERQGMTPAEIVSRWPHLTLASIYAALAYYHDHREELNAEIATDEAWYEEQRAMSPSLVREKLKGLGATDAADDSLSS